MSDVARVHYEIPDHLHRKAKAAAAMQGLTLREFVIQALASAVDEADRKTADDDPRD